MLSPKRERFCQEFVKCDVASDAYRAAYSTENMKPATVNNEAYKLLQLPHTAARVAELRAELHERVMCSLEDIDAELIEARELAKTADDHREMRAGTMDRAKLHGLIIDKSKVESKIDLGTHEEYIKEIKAIADAAKS